MFGCALCRCECEGDEVCSVDQLPRLNNKPQLILCFTNFQFTCLSNYDRALVQSRTLVPVAV